MAHGLSKQIIIVIDKADQRIFAVQQKRFYLRMNLLCATLLVVCRSASQHVYQSKMIVIGISAPHSNNYAAAGSAMSAGR